MTMPGKSNSAILLRISWSACIHCGACVAVCPLEEDFTTPFDTIAVDEPCRVACELCELICPVSAISHEQTPATVTD